nr:hypothetical protein [Tanacetum cinerariifolium]
MLVRQAYSSTALDTEFELLEAPSKTEDPQPLSPTSAPPSPDYTPTTTHINNELDSIEVFETKKRYWGTCEPIADIETESDELEDEGIDSKREEATSEDNQQLAVLAEDTIEDGPLSLGYKTNRRYALERVRDTTLPSPVEKPASPEWFLESPPISSVVPLLVGTPALAATLEEGDLLEIGAQLELYGSILYTHTERLDALPPRLFEGNGWDFTKFFSRSAVVSKEILS